MRGIDVIRAIAFVAEAHHQEVQERYRQFHGMPLHLKLRCSNYDRPFGYEFRYFDDIFYFRRSYPIVERTGQGEFIAEGHYSVPISRMNLGGIKCPYCRDEGFFKCTRCKTLVCMGRSAGNRYFWCHERCNASSPRVPVYRVEGSMNAPVPNEYPMLYGPNGSRLADGR